MESSFSSWRVIVSVHSPFWRVFGINGFPHCNNETTHLRGLLEFLDLVFLLQNSVEKNLNVSPIIDIGMSRPRLPHYWPNGDPDPVN